MALMDIEMIPLAEMRRDCIGADCVECGNGTVSVQVFCKHTRGGQKEWVFTGFSSMKSASAFAKMFTKTNKNKR